VLRRLLILVVVAAGVAVAWQLRKFLRARLLPGVPGSWRAQAGQSTVIAEGLDLRDRLARLVAREDRTAQRSLLLDVHAILAEVVELERLRTEVQAHMAEVGDPSLGHDAQRRETQAALAARAERYRQESGQVVADLQQVYLELLETREAGRGGSAQAALKTRALIDTLRRQTGAERELSRFLERER